MKRLIFLLGIALLFTLTLQTPASADPIKGVITTTSFSIDNKFITE